MEQELLINAICERIMYDSKTFLYNRMSINQTGNNLSQLHQSYDDVLQLRARKNKELSPYSNKCCDWCSISKNIKLYRIQYNKEFENRMFTILCQNCILDVQYIQRSEDNWQHIIINNRRIRYSIFINNRLFIYLPYIVSDIITFEVELFDIKTIQTYTYRNIGELTKYKKCHNKLSLTYLLINTIIIEDIAKYITKLLITYSKYNYKNQ